MSYNKELYHEIIRFIGDVEHIKPYFTINELKIPNYSPKEIADTVSVMIEGKIIDGIFAEDESSEHYGYLIGGLTTESRYLYHQLMTH